MIHCLKNKSSSSMRFKKWKANKINLILSNKTWYYRNRKFYNNWNLRNKIFINYKIIFKTNKFNKNWYYNKVINKNN